MFLHKISDSSIYTLFLQIIILVSLLALVIILINWALSFTGSSISKWKNRKKENIDTDHDHGASFRNKCIGFSLMIYSLSFCYSTCLKPSYRELTSKKYINSTTGKIYYYNSSSGALEETSATKKK